MDILALKQQLKKREFKLQSLTIKPKPMSVCPYPGPPCTTKSVSTTQTLALSGESSAIKAPPTDIGWSKRYFTNPIVSSDKAEISIIDESTKNLLVSFKPVSIKANPLKNGYLFYIPEFKKELSVGQTVIYKMKMKTKLYQFAILVMAD